MKFNTRAAALAGAMLLAAGVASAASSDNPPRYPGQGASYDADESAKTVALVGDSIIMQAGPTVKALAEQRGHTLNLWGIPGNAPCDFLPGYGAKMTQVQPSRVVFAFVGNATTDCMVDRLGARPPGVLSATDKQRIISLYRGDLTTLIRWNNARSIETVLVLPPPMAPGTWHGQLTQGLTDLYQDFVNGSTVTVTDGVRQILAPDGYRASIAVDGVNVRIRHIDGTHLTAPLGTTLYATGLLPALIGDRP